MKRDRENVYVQDTQILYVSGIDKKKTQPKCVLMQNL